MASINIEQHLSTPAHEWAADTTNALKGASSAGPVSGASTPGAEFPGAFPGSLQTHSQAKSPAEERTPQTAAKRLADAAPPKSTSDLQGSAKSYMPYVDVQRALDTAKAYLPESVVGAVGSVLPSVMTNAQTEKTIDPTSGAKPASSSPGSTSVDNASTAANPPSTRTASFTSSIADGNRTPSVAAQHGELGSTLDPTSQAKPITSASTLATSTMPTSAPESTSTMSPAEAGNTGTAIHNLPTPPASDGSSPANSHPVRQESGLTAPTSNQYDSKSDGPTPLPKDESPHVRDKSESSQPVVNTTPAQEHVKSGTAVGARLPGTSPAGGDGAPPSLSPRSEISNPHVPDDDKKDPRREEKVGKANRNASSSDESLEENGIKNRKKEGRVKKVVHKVKDKLSHRGH